MNKETIGKPTDSFPAHHPSPSAHAGKIVAQHASARPHHWACMPELRAQRTGRHRSLTPAVAARRFRFSQGDVWTCPSFTRSAPAPTVRGSALGLVPVVRTTGTSGPERPRSVPGQVTPNKSRGCCPPDQCQIGHRAGSPARAHAPGPKKVEGAQRPLCHKSNSGLMALS